MKNQEELLLTTNSHEDLSSKGDESSQDESNDNNSSTDSQGIIEQPGDITKHELTTNSHEDLSSKGDESSQDESNDNNSNTDSQGIIEQPGDITKQDYSLVLEMIIHNVPSILNDIDIIISKYILNVIYNRKSYLKLESIYNIIENDHEYNVEVISSSIVLPYNPETYSELVKYLENLEYNQKEDNFDWLSLYHNIEGIEYSYPSFISDKINLKINTFIENHLFNILQCSTLEILAICKFPKANLLLEIGGLTNLRVLNISGCTMSQDLLDEILKLQKLEELYLGEIYTLKKEFTKSLIKLPNLRALGLEKNIFKYLKNPTISHVSNSTADVELDDLCAIESLNHLYFRSIKISELEAFKLRNMSSLTSIVLNKMTVDIEIMNHFAHMKSLSKIHIINCTLYGMIDSEAILPLNSHLKLLRFENIVGMTEERFNLFYNNIFGKIEWDSDPEIEDIAI